MAARGLELRDGIFYLIGPIDEVLDLAPALKQQGALRLNLAGVVGVSSLGIRQFLAAMKMVGARPIEFHECATEFVDAVNMIPNLIGTPPDVRRIVSLQVPYYCPRCRQQIITTVKRVDLRVDAAGTVAVPPGRCGMCNGPTGLAVEAEDYFLFMTCEDHNP